MSHKTSGEDKLKLEMEKLELERQKLEAEVIILRTAIDSWAH